MTETTLPAKVASIKLGGALNAFIPQDWDEAWRLSQMIVRAGLIPRGYTNAESVMVGILYGLELGMTPMAALQSIAVINNQPAVWGDGLLAICLSSGDLEWFDETFEGKPGSDEFKAVCIVKRKGYEKTFRAEFSVADAKTARLWDERTEVKRFKKGGGESWMAPNDAPWFRFPKRMLQMRARVAFRNAFADRLRGLRMREEIDPETNAQAVEEQAPAIAAPAGPMPPTEAPPMMIEAQETPEVTVPATEEVAEWTPGPAVNLDYTGEVFIYDRDQKPKAGDRIEITSVTPTAPRPREPQDWDAFMNETIAAFTELTADTPDVKAKWQAIWNRVKEAKGEMFPPDFDELAEIADETLQLCGLGTLGEEPGEG